MALPVISALLPRSRASAPAASSPVVSEPPLALPPGRVVHVLGRGEFFVRDTGEADRPCVLLLHGWMFSSDLNWFTTYADLHEAGYRVLALDHRGHGRGLRTIEPFRLQDCADDAAAVMRELRIDRALVVGYSMGGAVAQLLARDHRELVRGSAVDLAEAGRELGRFDARPWNAALDVPVAVVVTRDDTSVPPDRQRELAAGLRAPVFESPGNHGAVTTEAREFNPVLLAALGSVAEREPHVLSAAA